MINDKPRTRVQFARRNSTATGYIDLGTGAVVIGIDGNEILIPAGQTRLILCPEGAERWTHNGVPSTMPRFLPLGDPDDDLTPYGDLPSRFIGGLPPI